MLNNINQIINKKIQLSENIDITIFSLKALACRD